MKQPPSEDVSCGADHVIKEVWRGALGVLYLCHLECTCSWRTAEVADPALLRIPRELHLGGPWTDVDTWVSEPDTAPFASPLPEFEPELGREGGAGGRG